MRRREPAARAAAGDCHALVTADPHSGRETIERSFAALKVAFPDWHVAIESMVAEGDRVVDRFRVNATHTGSVDGIPPIRPAHRRAGNPGVAGGSGKIAEAWYLTDAMPAVAAALLQAPAPASANGGA